MLRARLAGKARHARKAQSEVQGPKFRKLRTQHPELRTADRFLHEQRPQFGSGSWHHFKRAGADIKRVQAIINYRPRKVLSWHSPAHALYQLVRHDLECTLTSFQFHA